MTINKNLGQCLKKLSNIERSRLLSCPQAASAVWASPSIEGDPRRDLRSLGMTDISVIDVTKDFHGLSEILVYRHNLKKRLKATFDQQPKFVP